MLKSQIHKVLKSAAVKRGLYRSGLLGCYHRWRNRHALTVVIFHRVIAPGDPRLDTADPDYTVSTPVFEDCLRFFRRHYSVVSIEQLLSAADGRGRLPERPLHITFDDGWSDNEEFCVARLKRAGLPATVFVVSDAVDRAEPFWQERLVIAWRRGALTPEHCQELWRSTGEPGGAPGFIGDRRQLEPLRALTARLALLEDGARDALLSGLGDVLEDGVRHMITGDQLRAMARAPLAIGAHGKTHTPLLRAADPEGELLTSRTALASRLGVPLNTMSFPHGSYSPSLVDAAHRAGYQLVFTSDSGLASTVGCLTRCVPRVAFTEDGVTDDRGALAPEKLALVLFRKPILSPSF